MADFVDKIVKDPKNPPATVMLTGYIGASSEADHKRLYFDPHLSSYADIPNADILHEQDAKSGDGLHASFVWIKRNAQITYGTAVEDRPKGTFLDGPIMRDHAGGAGGAAASQIHAIATITSSGHLCPTHTPNCNVASFPTITAMGHICPSHTPNCGGGPHTLAAFGPISTPTITAGGFVCPSSGCGHTQHPQAAFGPISTPTITAGGFVCPSSGCHHTQHPQAAFGPISTPTITFQGFVCPSTGCGHTHHPVAQIATITFQGHVCASSTPGCGHPPHHTMAQFIPNYYGQGS
jgi:hypothetical protein